MSQTFTITGRLASAHKKIDITNAEGEVVYTVSSKVASIHHTGYVTDARTGKQIAEINAKVVSLHHIYYVDMADGTSFQLSTEFFHLKDIKDIPELNLQLRGNVMDFNFSVVDLTTNEEVARAHRHLASLHRIFDLEVLDESRVDELVCIFVVLKRMIDIRKKQQMADITTP